MTGVPLYAQLINLLAAILLLLAFAMLTQRRVLSLVNLFAAQGLALGVSTAIVGPDVRAQGRSAPVAPAPADR
jgi:hydrogenase-4 component E